MNELSDLAYRIDPVLWVRNVLGLNPRRGSQNFCVPLWGLLLSP